MDHRVSAKRIFAYLGLVMMLVMVGGGVMWAQTGTGELTGIVSDPQGAVVSGAKLNLTNTSTGNEYNTLTTTGGVYRFVALPVVGSYTLNLQQSGFKAVKIEGIVVSVGTSLTHDIRLQLGTLSETVTVEATAETVQTADSAVSALIDHNVWQNMPLEFRNQNIFINLAAGVVQNDQGSQTSSGTNSNRGAAVNGARPGTGNYLLEGTDNNEQGQAGRGQLGGDPGGASTSISPDAIQEYRVITNSFSAEYGKAGGFVTDTVLKSGTNQWHGSAFEYNRVQALAAEHYFATPAKPDRLVRNQFGFSVGGPVVKDKTFFFYTMEWHRRRSAQPTSATGTTQQFLDFVKSGAFEQWAESSPNGVCMQSVANGGLGHACPGAFSHSATLGPLFQKMFAAGPFPLATTGLTNVGQGFYTTGLTYPVPVYGDVFVADGQTTNEYRISAKVDQKLSSKDQLSVVYLNQTATTSGAFDGGLSTIGPAFTNPGRGQNAAVTWNHTFSPTVLNSAKFSYLRHRSDFPPAPGTAGIPAIATATDPLGVGFGLTAGLPQFFTENQFQWQENLSFQRGKHSFKTGAEYRRTRNGSRFFNVANGEFLPWGIEDLVTDLAFTDEADLAILGLFKNGGSQLAAGAVDPSTGKFPNVYRGYRANEFAAYFQDDWRLSARLTVNWGLRWEYFGPPHNFVPNIDSNFYFGTTVTPITTTSNNPFFPKNVPFYAGVATGTFQIRNHEIWQKDTNNFGPRLGFAYDVTGKGKLVLRAGGGVAYDRIYNNIYENIRFNPPFYTVNTIGGPINGVPVGQLSSPGLYTVPFTSNGLLNSPAFAPKPNPRHMNQDIVTPYYEQAHLDVQYEFLRGWVLDTGYVGTFGHKLMGIYDINTFDGRRATGFAQTRINPNVGADNFRTNCCSSNYHSWQTTVRKNFSHGLQFNASYTYAKAMDDVSDAFFSRTAAGSIQVGDTMNPKYDYGPADFNIRHRVVASLTYELPFFKSNRWLGGWSVNSITSLQGGVPFSPYSSSSSYDANKDGNFIDRLVYVGPGGPMNSVTGGNPATGYFKTTGSWARVVCPATVNSGLWCDAPIGRNTLSGPGYKNEDFGVTKKFKVTERVNVALQANWFNVFNHPNFYLPAFNSSSSSYGRSTFTFDPRITQLAARVDF
jgi:hypothetical protein